MKEKRTLKTNYWTKKEIKAQAKAMKKGSRYANLKKKRKPSEITAICRTKEEEFVMTVLIIYCQNAYRELKKERKVLYFNQIIMRAEYNYQEMAGTALEQEKNPVIWG